MTYPPPVVQHKSAGWKDWLWFLGILSVLNGFGVFIGAISMMPLAMATDPCYGDSNPMRVCKLTAAGQHMLFWTPWIALLGAGLSALASATLFAVCKRSPLYGLIFWLLGGALTMLVAGEIAFHL